MTSEPKTITVDEGTLTLCIQRKRVKNVNARLRGSTLYISAPPRMPAKRVEEISRDLARKLLRRERARQQTSPRQRYTYPHPWALPGFW